MNKFIVTILFSAFAVVACGTKDIVELKSRTTAYEEVPECVQFDRLSKKRRMDCTVDEDCFEVATPRATDCYVPITGNVVDKPVLEDVSRKCAARYKDEKLCDMLIPQKPVCKKSRCELVTK